MKNYYDHRGEELTEEVIRKAVAAGLAVISRSHGDWRTMASLIICEDKEEAERQASRDTRGECYSMWEESWCDYPKNAREALDVARCIV